MDGFNVGIDAYMGEGMASNGVKEINFKFPSVDENDADQIFLMYHDIVKHVGLTLNRCCIIVEHKYSNDTRKEFVKQGLSCGFKKVELINENFTFYINAVLKSNHIPELTDDVWILDDYNDLHLFSLRGSNSSHNGTFEIDGLKEIAKEKKWDSLHNVLYIGKRIRTFHHQKYEHIKEIFSQDNIFEYEFCADVEVALLKAKTMLTEKENKSIFRGTDTAYWVKLGDKFLTMVKHDTFIPCIIGVFKLTAADSCKRATVNKVIFLDDDVVEEQENILLLPSFSQYFLELSFDENMIYSVKFTDATNYESYQHVILYQEHCVTASS